MEEMKRIITLSLLVASLVAGGPVPIIAQEEGETLLPLPKPGAPRTSEAPGTASSTKKIRKTGEELLPLPETVTDRTPQGKTPVKDPEALIPLPGDKNPNPSKSVQESPIDIAPISVLPPTNNQGSPQSGDQGDSAEIIIGNEPPLGIPANPPSNQTAVVSTVPPNTTTPSPTSVPPANQGSPAPQQPSGPLPVFPKDTSSAIFMVMKTWECENYDGKTILQHAAGVYGQEAEDSFEIKGLDQLQTFQVTLKEDDVTLDELLDSIGQKAGIDWGVDIAQKTIYIYPGKK